jgi:hypothetical protein
MSSGRPFGGFRGGVRPGQEQADYFQAGRNNPGMVAGIFS